MPASTMKCGLRDNIINLKFHKEYQKKTGSTIDYKTFKDIIVKTNKNIQELVCKDPQGFKLPEGIGYLVVTKYRSTKRPTNYKGSLEHDTYIIHNNIHSNQAMHAIKLYNGNLSQNTYTKLYKFKGCRTLTRAVSKAIFNEVPFRTMRSRDFFNYNQAMRVYKKTQKNGSN